MKGSSVWATIEEEGGGWIKGDGSLKVQVAVEIDTGKSS